MAGYSAVAEPAGGRVPQDARFLVERAAALIPQLEVSAAETEAQEEMFAAGQPLFTTSAEPHGRVLCGLDPGGPLI